MIFLALFLVVINPVIAAEVWFQDGKSKNHDVLVIEGEIKAGDFDQIKKEIFEFGPLIRGVYLYSPGGDAREAMKIGDMMRSLYLSTVSPDFSLKEYQKDRSNVAPECNRSWEPKPKSPANCTCDSACFLIWVGGLNRDGNYVGVHRPVFNKSYYSSISSNEAEALYQNMLDSIQAYLEKYKVPRDVIGKMINTPSHKIHGLWAEKLGGYPAFYEERLTAICGALSNNVGRISLLKRKKVEGRITTKEEKQLEKLQPEQQNNEKIKKCRFTQYAFKDKLQAFEDYFGEGYIDQWRNK